MTSRSPRSVSIIYSIQCEGLHIISQQHNEKSSQIEEDPVKYNVIKGFIATHAIYCMDLHFDQNKFSVLQQQT